MPWGILAAPALAMLEACAPAGGPIHLTAEGMVSTLIGLAVIAAAMRHNAHRVDAARRELARRHAENVLWSVRMWEGQ